jgi:hypothetical protein
MSCQARGNIFLIIEINIYLSLGSKAARAGAETLPSLLEYDRYMHFQVRAVVDKSRDPPRYHVFDLTLSRLQQRNLHQGKPLERLCMCAPGDEAGDYLIIMKMLKKTSAGKVTIRTVVRPAKATDASGDCVGITRKVEKDDENDSDLDSESSVTVNITEIGNYITSSYFNFQGFHKNHRHKDPIYLGNHARKFEAIRRI